MIIILEGENKTGKTTLANVFKNFDFKYIKCSQPKGDPYIEYMNILKKIKENTVIDRFAYGEFVYGPLYRGESKLSKEQLRNIELKLLSLGTRLIYCYDKPKNIAKRFLEEKEEFADVKKIRKTLKLYKEVFKDNILKKNYHVMKTDKDLLINKDVYRFITERKKPKFNFKDVIGNTFNPRIILVGDKRNIKANFKYNNIGQPFDFGKSSKFLFEAIERAGIPLNHLMVLNADNKNVDKLKLYKKSIIISLGNNSNNILNKKKINNTRINHPSFESRFNHNNLNLYARKLFKLYKRY